MSKICRQCNSKLEEGLKYCPHCGLNQENGSATSSKSTEFTPTIEVFRESSLVGCLLSFRVFVDDKEIGRVKNGEKKRFQIGPGLHEVYVKLNWTWFSSPKVSFMLKDFMKFSCQPQVGILGFAIKVPYYSLFKRHKFISLKEN